MTSAFRRIISGHVTKFKAMPKTGVSLIVAGRGSRVAGFKSRVAGFEKVAGFQKTAL